MSKKGSRTVGRFAFLAVVIVLGLVFVYRPYRRDRREAYQALREKPREMVKTACGAIEAAVRGEGTPVLVIHGAAGGFDQGQAQGADHVGDGYRVIAPSRFGYLGTRLPKDPTPAAQADALVCLLDELGIEKTAVIAYSAGGPAAVQLALRHPQRVSALVLVSTAIADKPVAMPPRAVLNRVFRSDFLFWLMAGPLRPLGQRMFIPADYELSSEEEALVAGMMEDLLPIAPRADGLINDMYVTNADPHLNGELYQLEELEVSTLVVNARDDPAAVYADARAMSERMPHATLLTVESGGHLMLGNGDQVTEAIGRFLDTHAAERGER